MNFYFKQSKQDDTNTLSSFFSLHCCDLPAKFSHVLSLTLTHTGLKWFCSHLDSRPRPLTQN